MDVEFIRHKYEDSHHGVITKAKFRLGVRHIQMVYMFVCSFVMGAMRSSNGIAILAVADYTRGNGTDIQIHNWDKKIQGTILSSFFIGYASIMVPAEIYLKQFGDKFIMTAILLINGALTAAMPTVVVKENHKDMTQNYSDTLLMMSSAVSSAAAGLVPVVTGVVVNGDGVELKRWKIVFLSLASLYIICNVIYTSFASSDRQEWDRTAQNKFGYCNALTNFELEEMNRSNDLDRKIEEDTSL